MRQKIEKDTAIWKYAGDFTDLESTDAIGERWDVGC